ncbi:hypothetical protein ACROYT_G006696 [Oculina patagonica]
MHFFLHVLLVGLQVLTLEVSCDYANDKRLLEEYNKFQRIPSAKTTSNKLQMHFLTQTDSSRLKRQLRGDYDIIYIIDSSSSISRAEFQTGARAGSFRRVLIVTDGQSNIKRDRTLWKAMDLKLNGAEIFVIGIGEYVEGIDELAHLATTLDAHLYRAGDMQGLVEIVKLITPVSYRRNWAAEVLRLRQAFILGRY